MQVTPEFAATDQVSVPEADILLARADSYSILAALLSAPPTPDLIDYLKHIRTTDTDSAGPVGQAWLALRDTALDSDPEQLDDEYHRLFIGLGRGEVVPYGSWHMTGYLMEKPLSDLRDDLRRLGLEADDGEKDPEDHIAALCECMALLIRDKDAGELTQGQFFERHVNPWAGKFFKELHQAGSAVFYKPVGVLGQRFIDLESQYLNIQIH